MKTVFIGWEKYHARTSLLGKTLGAKVVFISRLGRVSGPALLLKYVLQSWDTMVLLLRERPDVILVQTPPVFVAVWATLYAALFRGARVIIDAHSGSFLSRKWAWALPLQRWCSRRAQMTIVHMPSLLPLVEAWGAPAMEMAYVFEEKAPPARVVYELPAGTNIAVPCSFNQDEPVELIFRAAEQLPDVRFYLTGDTRRVPAELLDHKPANVLFTGYLAVPAYIGLLRDADAVLALTTQDQTFQTGGAEAVWLARPLLISNWPELRQLFTRGTVFVEHTAAGLAEGVRAMQARRQELEVEMQTLKREFDWGLQARYRRLQGLINDSELPQRSPVGDLAADKEH